jgi:4-hydroxyphenylacetate 3-hydroxylase-like protein
LPVKGKCAAQPMNSQEKLIMGAGTGQEYIEGLRDERSIYVNGELVRDVTQHPSFRGVIQTMAGLYDRQHEPAYKDLLTYPSPTSGAPVSTSFIMPKTCLTSSNGFVTDTAVIRGLLGRRERRFGENAWTYYE